ncbi:MAG: glycosyltransferase [Spartobacteria bacterium]|nr:glycosyltransferase [Spartobacteria bacterium]
MPCRNSWPSSHDEPNPESLMSSSCVLSYCDVSRPINGRSRRMFALLEALGGASVLFEPQHPHPLTDTVVYRPDFGRKKVGINWGIFNFYWPRTRRLVQRHIYRMTPSVTILTSIWDERPLRSYTHLPLVLDAHNVDAAAMAERFGPAHPFTRCVRAQEQRVASRMQHIFSCSEIDRQAFIERYGVTEDRVSVVPNGADVRAIAREAQQEFPPELEDRLAGRIVLFFMGKLDYQPNKAALDFMNTHLMPRLEAARPGAFTLLVCGGPVPAGAFHPSIIFTGQVEKLPPCIRRADICLAPLFSGSGTRFKIIEYLACRRPVVSTPKGAEGLGCVSGEHLLLAEAEAFADRILSLSDTPEQRRLLGEQGYAHIAAHFDWQAIIPGWQSVLSQWS